MNHCFTQIAILSTNFNRVIRLYWYIPNKIKYKTTYQNTTLEVQ